MLSLVACREEPRHSTAPARRLRVGVVEDETTADQAAVVIEHRAVQVQQAFLVDEDLRAVRPFEYLVAEPRFALPGKRVAQARTSAAFDANGGVFEPLLNEQDAIISDELNHASIIDGVRLCKAQRFRYKHNNMDELEKALGK